MVDIAVCEHTPIPVCPIADCGQPQKMRSDGVPMGHCDEHHREKLPHVEIGTVSPGPKGVGWRVKTANGWRKSTRDGMQIVAGGSRPADPRNLTDRQAQVLDALGSSFPLTDFEIAVKARMPHSSAGTRRLELQRAGLVEQDPVPGKSPFGGDCDVHRLTDAGHALFVARANLEFEAARA